MNRKTWTPREIEFLKSNFKAMSRDEIAKHLGRSRNAIQDKSKSMGLLTERNMWKDDEIEYLIRAYPSQPIADIANHLGRSEPAIKARARIEGLKRDSTWTPSDLKFLRNNYKIMSNRQIAASISKTDKAVQSKAFEMGLSKRGKENYEPAPLPEQKQVTFPKIKQQTWISL